MDNNRKNKRKKLRQSNWITSVDVWALTKKTKKVILIYVKEQKSSRLLLKQYK